MEFVLFNEEDNSDVDDSLARRRKNESFKKKEKQRSFSFLLTGKKCV